MSNRGTTNEQLERKCRGVPGFLGVFSADNLPRVVPPDASLIANYSNQSEPGTHWIAILHLNDRSRQPEFFDSFGFPPDGENVILGTTAKFDKYMKYMSVRAGAGGKYLYNKLNMQCSRADVCGEYAAWAIQKQTLPENMRTGAIKPEWKQILNLTTTCQQSDELVKRRVGIRA